MQDPSWSNLTYFNPTKMLLGLDELFDSSGIRKFKNPADLLLDRRVRDIGEDRRCAIFCHGVGQIFDKKILFAPLEKSDYDYVGVYEHEGASLPFPIQLKQLIPDRLNPSTDLQTEIDKLKKYSGAADLVVALHINRKIQLKPSELDVSGLKIKEIWLFGQLGPKSLTWLLFGNLMKNDPKPYRFQLPAV